MMLWQDHIKDPERSSKVIDMLNNFTSEVHLEVKNLLNWS
jgi:hypothetical protein